MNEKEKTRTRILKTESLYQIDEGSFSSITNITKEYTAPKKKREPTLIYSYDTEVLREKNSQPIAESTQPFPQNFDEEEEKVGVQIKVSLPENTTVLDSFQSSTSSDNEKQQSVTPETQTTQQNENDEASIIKELKDKCSSYMDEIKNLCEEIETLQAQHNTIKNALDTMEIKFVYNAPYFSITKLLLASLITFVGILVPCGYIINLPKLGIQGTNLIYFSLLFVFSFAIFTVLMVMYIFYTQKKHYVSKKLTRLEKLEILEPMPRTDNCVTIPNHIMVAIVLDANEIDDDMINKLFKDERQFFEYIKKNSKDVLFGGCTLFKLQLFCKKNNLTMNQLRILAQLYMNYENS